MVRIQGIATEVVPVLKDLSHEEELKEIQLTKLEIRREDLIIGYRLTNELEETNRNDPPIIPERKAGYIMGH